MKKQGKSLKFKVPPNASLREKFKVEDCLFHGYTERIIKKPRRGDSMVETLKHNYKPISRKGETNRFSWQEGYGAFSYSRSQRDKVIRYIIVQEKHHAGKSFKEEYLDLLRKFEIRFEENYVFEFYD
jgi:hypothetical protein